MWITRWKTPKIPTIYNNESVYTKWWIIVENTWITCGYMVDKSEDFHIGKGENMKTGVKSTVRCVSMRKIERKIQKGQMYYVKGGKFYIDGKGGGRPAVIVSGEMINGSNRCTVVFLTSHTNGMESLVPVKISDTNTSYAICGELMTIWKDRLENYIGTVSKETMAEIDRQINKCRDLDTESAVNVDMENVKKVLKNQQFYIGCQEKAESKTKDEIIAIQEKEIWELKIERNSYKRSHEVMKELLMEAIKGAKS